MMDDFYAATNNPYALVSDAYRSFADQEGKSIPAGYSDHHTGYLVSIKFYDDTGIYTSENPKYADAYAWLNTHAAEYGFVMRYPASKTLVTSVSDYTYSYRYVGLAHATYMSANNLCLEEYVALLRNSYVFGGEHLKITDSKGTNYEVYYIPAATDTETAIYVPASSGGFEISGDNEAGYRNCNSEKLRTAHGKINPADEVTSHNLKIQAAGRPARGWQTCRLPCRFDLAGFGILSGFFPKGLFPDENRTLHSSRVLVSVADQRQVYRRCRRLCRPVSAKTIFRRAQSGL